MSINENEMSIITPNKKKILNNIKLIFPKKFTLNNNKSRSRRKIFPLKRFWDHLVVVNTHFFCDPNEESPEEMMQTRNKTNGIIFSNLMEKIKNISDILDYTKLRIKYYNSYSPVRNENQRIQNNKNKEDLEILLNELSEKEPLFCFIELMQVKNERIVEDGITYLVEYEVIGFFDLNHQPIKEKTNIISKKIIKNEYTPPPPSSSFFRSNINKNNEHNIIPIPPEESKLRQYKSEIGVGVGGLIGLGIACLAGAGAAAAFGIVGGGALAGYGIAQFFV